MKNRMPSVLIIFSVKQLKFTVYVKKFGRKMRVRESPEPSPGNTPVKLRLIGREQVPRMITKLDWNDFMMEIKPFIEPSNIRPIFTELLA